MSPAISSSAFQCGPSIGRQGTLTSIVSWSSAVVTTLLVLQNTFPAVHGHGYVTSPRSRNYHAREAGKQSWQGGTAADPLKENEPQSANKVANYGGGSYGVCGVILGHNYDAPPNAVGGVLPNIVQATFTEGDIVEFEVVLTAHHKGHFEYRACAISPGEIPAQSCFNDHPLEYVSDPLHSAPKDVNYPERAYIPNSSTRPWNYQHRYKLPSGVSGDNVLIQWKYITANSCNPPGYDNYPFPSGFLPGSVATCGALPPDGNGLPEQFWNCVDVKINSSGSQPSPPSRAPPSSPPPPSRAPPSSPSPPSRAPPSSPSPPPPANCPAASNSCGPNNPCAGGSCCSQWGYCGTTDAFCGTCCQSNCSPTNPAPAPSPPPAPPSNCPAASNSCGPNKPCASGSCCSKWGYCGTTEAYCGTCCQSNCGL